MEALENTNDGKSRSRRRIAVVVLSLAMPGLGHVYLKAYWRGLALAAAFGCLLWLGRFNVVLIATALIAAAEALWTERRVPMFPENNARSSLFGFAAACSALFWVPALWFHCEQCNGEWRCGTSSAITCAAPAEPAPEVPAGR